MSSKWSTWGAILAVLALAAALPAAASNLSNEQQESLQSLWSVLLAVYDNDDSQIPSDPNAIMALETSPDSKDQLTWAIFCLMRLVVDPNAADLDELFPLIDSDDEISSKTLADDPPTEATSFMPDDDNQMMMTYSMPERIEEIDNPLGSCILSPGTYRIQSPPLYIEGHVVMPAGVRLIAPYDPNSNIIEVLPGGLLDTGRAAFYTQNDYPSILPPVEILPEDPNILFTHNNVGIYVYRGADPKTRLENLEISGCRVGIVIDEQLAYPLRRIITFGCYDGIHLYAPAGIMDCQFWFNGSIWNWMSDYILAHLNAYINGTIFEDEYVSAYASAAVYVHPDGEAFPYAEIVIERTVMDTADVGLYVRAAYSDPNLPDPNVMAPLIPRISVVNSTFSLTNFYGLYKTDGEAAIEVQFSAFADNSYYHTNVELPYTGCFAIPYDPFYLVEGRRRLYVDPWSHLIDAGYGIAEDGMGTAHDRPDTGRMNIGTHFPLGISGAFAIPASPADFNWDGIVDELDLEIMEMCMGAINDPNVVRLDLNYDSRINLPDFALFAFDYGYSSDPNESLNNDPNCARSDFNGDNRVDIEDLAILTEHWLSVVFDEYRFCSLCNFVASSDPNEPEAIDENDMAAFMAEWGVQYASDPNIVIDHSSSMLSVAVENPDPAWRISAFLDNEPIGQWEEGGLGLTAFDADLIRFGPGSHKLKIVRNIGFGLEITEQIVTDPNSIGLYFADIPDTFDPNEPYLINGFNLSDELNVKVKDLWENSIYDVNLPYGNVNLEIPSEVFAANQFCTLDMEGYGSFGANNAKRDLVKEFNKADYEGKTVQMVIVLPDKDIFKRRLPSILACAKACEKRSVNWVPLYNKDVTAENLTYLLGRQTVRYVYWCGHGNSHVGRTEEQDQRDEGGVARTNMSCWKHIGRKWRLDKWEQSRAFSYFTTQEPLPDEWEQRGFSLWSIHMYDTVNKWIVFIDCCRSAVVDVYDDVPDMARTFGISNSGNNNQIYIGWRKDVATTLSGEREVFSPRNFEKHIAKINPGIKRFWEQMGAGSTVYSALQATTNYQDLPEAETVLALWGYNMQMDLSGQDDDNYKRDSIRVWGNGLTNTLSNAN